MTAVEKGIVIFCAIGASIMMFFVVDRKPGTSIEINRVRCIEICVREIQSRGVFPHDYHETMELCRREFAGETCRLVGGKQ